jgi:hypothetical protein
MKKDFTTGIISGVVLTFIGVFIQFQMNKNYENTKEIQRLNNITIKQLDNRLTRSYSILLTSKSTVFKDRWNNYIYTVFYPWNSDLYILDAHIKQNHLAIYNKFENVCADFRTIHNILNDIRKLQKPSTKKENNKLEIKEKEVKEKLDSLTTKINVIKNELSE